MVGLIFLVELASALSTVDLFVSESSKLNSSIC
jgi:hypothetical protein